MAKFTQKVVYLGDENLLDLGIGVGPQARVICGVHSYVERSEVFGKDGEVYPVCWKCVNESNQIALTSASYCGPPGEYPICGAGEGSGDPRM